MVNNEPSFEERNIQQWVMTSSKPSPKRDNGLHVYDCHFFHERDKYPPRKATVEEMKTLRSCTVCKDMVASRQVTRKCPIHHIVLSVNGTCDECDL